MRQFKTVSRARRPKKLKISQMQFTRGEDPKTELGSIYFWIFRRFENASEFYQMTQTVCVIIFVGNI